VLHFLGSFRNTTVWWNGRLVKNHRCGYTPFFVPLDGEDDSSNGTNTVAVYVDPDNGDDGGRARGSGWWYEGGGLYRPVRLIRHRLPPFVHIVREYEIPSDDEDYTAMPGGPGIFVKTEHLQNDVATLSAQVTVDWHGLGMVRDDPLPNDDYCYAFNVYDKDGDGSKGSLVSSTGVTPLPVPLWSSSSVATNTRRVIVNHLNVSQPKLWSGQTPFHMYNVEFVLYRHCAGYENATGDMTTVDVISTNHGIRTVSFDSSTGFHLNSRPFKIRGFCDHDTFAVVGMAVPDRVNLFRVSSTSNLFV
jgi:beta-galactosidase/beta-glucuronidase